MQVLLRDGLADLRFRRVWRGGAVSRLSVSEVEVLGLLLARRGETVERGELLTRALGFPPDSLSRAVDVCIHRLRSKLERDPARPVHLLTSQGEGYRLLPADESQVASSQVNLPRNPVLGRDHLVDSASDALSRGPIALIGPAGVGKTVLAQLVADRAARRLAPAGTFWVDLSAARDLADLVAAIAGSAGVAVDDAAGLGAALAARGPTLIVLDTCERCLPAVAALIAAVGASASVLATSREPVEGAGSFEVPALPPSAARELLVGRARDAGYEGAFPADVVDRVVEALERLPLAIELAAARLRSMSLSRLETELVRPLRVLRGRGNGRQTSVEASVRWSWELLVEAERRALIALSVFRAPLAVVDAEALAGTTLVARLQEVHLLRRVGAGIVPWHAVAELAEREALPHEWEAARRNRLGWLESRVQTQLRALWTPGFEGAIDELARLEPDLSDALDRGGSPWLARALCELDLENGRHGSVITRADASVASEPEHACAPALQVLAAASVGKQGRWSDALTRLASVRPIDPEDRVGASYWRAVALGRLGELEPARAEAARTLALAGDDPVLLARAYGAIAVVETHTWTGPHGVDVLQRALDAARAAGVARFVPIATHNLAVGLHRVGRVEEAERIYLDSTTLLVRNRRACGIAWNNVALMLLPRDPEASLRAAERALEAFSDAGAEDGARIAIAGCAMAHAALGVEVDALVEIEDAVDRLGGVRTGVIATQLLSNRASVYGMVGRKDACRRAFAEIADQMPSELGMSPEDTGALIAAWVDDRPLPAEVASRLGAVSGDRRWLHVVCLGLAGRVAPGAAVGVRGSHPETSRGEGRVW